MCVLVCVCAHVTESACLYVCVNQYVDVRCMCKYLSRKKIKSFYFRGTKTAQPALQVSSVISDNTYLSDTSKAERTRGGESRESLPSSSERRQLKSHTSRNKQFKESCQKSVTKETSIPFFYPSFNQRILHFT